MNIDMNAVTASLNLMWMGMLAIFTVIVVIFVVTQIMLTLSNRKHKSGKSNESR